MTLRISSLAVLVVAVLGAALPAHAAEYWTPKSLLGEYFKTAKSVSPHKFTLSDAAAAEITKKLGADVKKTWNIYIGEDDQQRRTGYALLDAEVGLHEPIDFGVRFNEKGAVDRLEIMAYREAYGDEVRAERFRKQFVGKTAGDPITAGKDIDIISGATYSSKSVALGVKRDTLVLQAALKNGL